MGRNLDRIRAAIAAAAGRAGRAWRDARSAPALVQVDFAGTRNGVEPEEVGDAVRRLRALAGIELRGLMTLPPMTEDPEDARPFFRRLRDLREELATGAD